MTKVIKYRLPKNTDGATKAFVNVAVNDMVINGIRVYQAKSGKLNIAMPQDTYEKDGIKKYSDIVHPNTRELRLDMSKTILDYHIQKTSH